MRTPAFILVHYHQRPGGVTTVMGHEERILRQAGQSVLVLTGDTLARLDYSPQATGSLTQELLTTVRQEFGDRPRIWHFHNPCLGKNPALTRSLAEMAAEGETMILQHHDLAEEGRHRNLQVLAQVEHLYPRGARIRHAFLNHRDMKLFCHGGLPPTEAILLPNPLPTTGAVPPPPAGPPLIQLPMRGLPRKNLGEMLLLAACAPESAHFVQGSAPHQPEWQASYAIWNQFSRQQGLSVTFDGFRSAPPRYWLERCTHLLTTSAHEGFGMIHLEALGHRRVLGRRLPHLDLETLPIDGLYDAIWIGGEDFPAHSLVDQQEIIRAAMNDALPIEVETQGCREPLRQWLAKQLAQRRPTPAPWAQEKFSEAAYLHRLLGVRDQLVRAPAQPLGQVDRQCIRAFFE